MDSTAFVPAPSTLYAVATPIGNLRDITLRALDVLRAVDRIAAEDTRLSNGLLQHFGIATRMIALHAHNERTQSARIVSLPPRVIAPEPNPCMANAKSASPSCAASASRSTQSARESSVGSAPPHGAGTQ